MPETGVQQVQHGVLDTADVQVDTAGMVRTHIGARPHPVALHLGVDEGVLVRRVEVAQLVPTRPGPLGHHIGVAPIAARSVAEVESDLDPVAESIEWALRIGELVVRVEGAGAERVGLGKGHGQHVVGQAVRIADLVIDDRERLAPVALTAEQPVAQLVADGRLAPTLLDQPGRGAGHPVGDRGETVEVEGRIGRVHVRRVTDEGLRPCRRVEGFLDAAFGEPLGRRVLDRRDRQVETAGELEVALVAARNGHDRPGAVAHEHVVGDPHRDGLAGERVGGTRPEGHTGLVPGVVLAVDVLAGRGLPAVVGDRRGPVRCGERLDEGVLGGEHHERRTEERVGAGGEHGDRSGGGVEVDPGAVAAPDPVALHRRDGVGPVEQVEIVDQPVGVGRDPHHPLAHVAREHREVAAVAATVGGDLLVGDDGAETGTPVDRRLTDVGQAMVVDDAAALVRRQVDPRSSVRGRSGAGIELGDQLCDRAGPSDGRVVPGVEDLGEDPLRPAVVVRVGRRDRPPTVVAEAETPQLASHVGDVGVGRDRRVLAGLHRVLLGRQTKRVEAHRVQHVAAEHALEAGVHVGADVAEWVSDVQAGTRRVREHVEHEQLVVEGGDGCRIGERARRIRCLEGAVGIPTVLPALLDRLGESGGVAHAGLVVVVVISHTEPPA